MWLKLCLSSHRQSAMALELITTQRLCFPGEGAPSWELKEHDFEDVGGDKFLKLPRGNFSKGFTRLVAFACPGVPTSKEERKEFSLTSSKGCAKLLEERTTLQAEHLKGEKVKKDT